MCTSNQIKLIAIHCVSSDAAPHLVSPTPHRRYIYMSFNNIPLEVISSIAGHLELRSLLRLSAVNTMFRNGCYDSSAVGRAIRMGGGSQRLTKREVQQLLNLSHVDAATLAHRFYPSTTFRPRGCYLYDATMVASAMHTFNANDRVVSWHRPPHCSTDAISSSTRIGPLRSKHDTPAEASCQTRLPRRCGAGRRIPHRLRIRHLGVRRP